MNRQSLVVRIFLILLILVCLFSDGGEEKAWAQRAYIDITQPSFEKLPIAIPDFKWQNSREKELGSEMVETLTNDLKISGVFRFIPSALFPEDQQAIGITEKEIRFDEWHRVGAEFLVRGLYEVQGSSLKLELRLFDTVNPNMLLGRVLKGRIKDVRAMIHRFVDEILLILTGERGVFETKIAFVQVQNKIKEIYVVDFDGKNSVQVTDDHSISLSPAWSQEGTRIAYVSYIEGAPRIYLLDLVSGSRKLLSGATDLNIAPAWRPGTNDLAATLSKKGNPNIYLLSPSGKIKRKLVGSWAIDVSPSWSPDGHRLAYVSSEGGNPQIYILDLKNGEKHRLTFEGKYNTSPVWSPKGDWIAYSSLTGRHHDIYMIRPDGSEVRRLTQGKGDNESPSWSPDGRMLAFSSTRGGGKAAIWVMFINGTGLRRLTDLPGSQRLPDWSPYFKRR
jgi:TolB protein